MKIPQTFRSSKLQRFIDFKERELFYMKELADPGDQRHSAKISAFEYFLEELRNEFNLSNSSEPE